ncbi:MAG: M23 family metallopeptidase [Clostridia bacterium]|nr:M23 family metallopeptidase [Clostridia bacterium]
MITSGFIAPVSATNTLTEDLNRDGIFSEEDAIYLLFNVYYSERFPVDQPCDYNSDGLVTDQDAIYLLFHLFYPTSYPINDKDIIISPIYNSSFIWPSEYRYISAGFSSDDYIHQGVHNGIDIAGSQIFGTPIYAIGDGVVTSVNNSCTHNYGKIDAKGCTCGNNYGNYAQIDHGKLGEQNNISAIYGHATVIIVSQGEYVKRGQTIGYVGSTGRSTGPHLHLGILRNGKWIDPLTIIR